MEVEVIWLLQFAIEDEKIYLGSYDSMEKAKKVLKIIMISLTYGQSIELPANDKVDGCRLSDTIPTLNDTVVWNGWKPGMK